MRKTVPGLPEWEADDEGKVYKNGAEIIGSNGKYAVVYLGKGKRLKRSVLVCLAFHGPKPFAKAEVRHLDDVKRNDVPGNLAWGTRSENAKDAYRNKRMKSYDTRYEYGRIVGNPTLPRQPKISYKRRLQSKIEEILSRNVVD